MTITDKIMIFCHDVNKTSVELLAVNILHVIKK